MPRCQLSADLFERRLHEFLFTLSRRMQVRKIYLCTISLNGQSNCTQFHIFFVSSKLSTSIIKGTLKLDYLILPTFFIVIVFISFQFSVENKSSLPFISFLHPVVLNKLKKSTSSMNAHPPIAIFVFWNLKHMS